MAEIFWYIIASLLAGVGTGLVGLSSATAIALASDILGSAVTSATYIRHKNIDLRRGWIMLACIIGM